ncbi:IPT/TIG domain-containing protein, partial [Sphingomonas soli]|uniref:IPT/TIG domain-containing protein n=1 Tax=Sphingomonas soli TaxID=266127 RepID=UPI000B2CAF74
SNWNAATNVPQSFTVTPATLTIAANAPTGATVGASYSQTNPASGGVAPYTYALDAGAFVPGTMLDVATGTVSGTPTVAGSFSYRIRVTDSQGTPVSAIGTITTTNIAKGAQTITFTSTPPTATVGGAPYMVSATASSGLPVSYLLDGSSTGCALSGTTVTFTSNGTCRINANQAGGANYDAAPQVQQSFAVGAAGVVGVSITYPASVSVGSTGTMTITFTNPNLSSTPAFNALINAPSIVTRVVGNPGGSCTVGGASIPTSTSIQLAGVVVPSGSCTVTFNYAGNTAGSTSGFTLGAFTPSGYPATAATQGNGFVVVPTVTSISPNSGPVSQVVTVSGTGFSTTPGNNIVSFGGSAGTVTAASSTSLTVTAPGAGVGPVSVTVTVNGQTSTSSATYTFIAKPVAADRSGVAVAYNSPGTAIDLSGAITGGPHSA